MTGSPGMRLAPDLPQGPRAALVIATTRYEDPDLSQLRAPAHDADDLAEVLADPGIGAFTVTRVIDQDERQARRAIDAFLSVRDVGDVVVVYLSCHGLLDRRNRLYFAATDTTKSQLGATGISSTWLLEQLEECRARRQVLILDCCFSGAFAHGSKGEKDLDLERRLGVHGRGQAVLTASRAGEYSFEGQALPGAAVLGSVFTAGLVKGLRTGAADAGGDGYVSVDEAYDYAYRYVQSSGASQTPQRWLSGGEGEILLARSPAGMAIIPALLPEDLAASLDSRYPAVRIGAVHELGGWLAGDDPGRAVTAEQKLQQIADTDNPAVAAAARAHLASPRQATALTGPHAHSAVPDETTTGKAAEKTPEAARQEVERKTRQGAEPQAVPNRIVIPLTQGSINNNYVKVAKHLDFFPADAIGGPNKQAGQGTPLKLYFEGFPGTEATDITSDHKSFRIRRPWQRFFERHDLRAGDKVAIERVSAYEYRVAPVRSAQSGRSEHLIAPSGEHVANVPPLATLGRADEQDLDRQRRLMALLREATGITDVEPVRPGIGAAVMLDRAVGTKSTQRIALQQQAGTLMLYTWPAELKSQAEALYRTRRAGRLMDLLVTHPDAWQAQPKIQLAIHNAPVAQRLYLHCHLGITEYVRRWSGDDFSKIGAHPFDHIREDLWPWLRERQYANVEDDQELDAFLKRLGHRDAHLRPGIEVRRIWPWGHAVDLDERGALASEVRTEVTELLTTLDEPLPPACINVR